MRWSVFNFTRRRTSLGLLVVLAAGMTGAAATRSAESEAALLERVEVLQRKIARHDDLYFRAAAPEISDEAYDRLTREREELLARLPPETALRIRREAGVGDDRAEGSARGVHRVPMLSLLKAYSDDAVATFIEGLPRDATGRPPSLVVEPKIDGVAISLTYADGRLVRALSRGNGHEGDDLSASLRAARLVPERLAESAEDPWPALIELRGEIHVPLAAFDRLNAAREDAGEPPFAHPRNLAAGSVRLQDPEELNRRGLAFIVHGFGAIEPATAAPPTQHDFYRRARAWGLPVVELERVDAVAELVAGAVLRRQRANGSAPYPTDGVVIKLDAIAAQRECGSSAGAPRWALARKFPAEQGRARIRRIHWQLGRSGRLTPVAELDPIELGGSRVARVTVHHAAELARLDLRVGDLVIVERAGGVIPAIVAVDLAQRPPASMAPLIPDQCPACGQPLKPAPELRCAAADCPAQVQRRIEHFAGTSGVGITGLGPATVARLVANGAVRSIADLYSVSDDALAAAGAGHLRPAIERSRQAPLDQWIAGLGLPGIGRARARQLAPHFDGLASFAEADREQLLAAGLSPAAAEFLLAALRRDEQRRLFAKLRASGVAPVPAGH